jgi:hypothetical protein
MQAKVWLHMVWFRAIWIDAVQFGASFANLRQPHKLKLQIYGKKNFSCIQVNTAFHFRCSCLPTLHFPGILRLAIITDP